jgi:serine/threonine protein kinase
LRAHDRRLDREVAIKVLRVRRADAEVRFLREAMVTARLQHDIPSLIDIHRFNRIVPWFLFGMTVVLSLVICRLYYISNKLLGPSERILKELDQMLSGERKDPVGTRPGDEIFEELFKRINPLLKRIQ